MQQYLYKYFALYGRLAIPGLGNFIAETTTARMDDSGTQVLAPLRKAVFNKGAVSPNKQFYDFLAREMEVDEVEAINRFRDFTQDLTTRVSDDAGVFLQGIGSLRQYEDGDISFQPVTDDQGLLFPPVQLPEGIVWSQQEQAVIPGPVSEMTAEPEEQEADATAKDGSWWIYAIILLLLGISAILFHYA